MFNSSEYKAGGDFVLGNGTGTMKAYRSHNKLADVEWNLAINNKAKK